VTEPGGKKEERGWTTDTQECCGCVAKWHQRARTRLDQQTTAIWRGL